MEDIIPLYTWLVCKSCTHAWGVSASMPKVDFEKIVCPKCNSTDWERNKKASTK